MMQKARILLVVLLFWSAFGSTAFGSTALGSTAQRLYVDASTLPLGGHGPWLSGSRYERLPTFLMGLVDDQLWTLGTNSSGLYVRFRSNSTSIGARWTVRGDVSMNHMTDIGIKGLDLYSYVDGEWQFVNSGRPRGRSTDAVIVSNMSSSMREYMLYLPLYDGLDSLSIGVDPGSVVESGDPTLIDTSCAVVFYGTSIVQGACASRPGMSGSSILARAMGREVINLGFSGHAKLDLPIARTMSLIENPYCYVLDFVPNCTVGLIEELMGQFISILRMEHPQTPIVIVENALFPHSLFDTSVGIDAKNRALRACFQALQSAGDRNLHYVPSDGLIGFDNEATVDGVHFTDLGFVRYCDRLKPVLRAVGGEIGKREIKNRKK